MSINIVQSAAQLAAMGGTLIESSHQAIEVFQRVITKASDLTSNSQDTVLSACRVIHLDINSLILYTGSQTERVELRVKHVTGEILSTDERYNTVYQRLQSVNSEVNYLQQHLEELKAKRYRLKLAIEEASTEINRLQAQIEEEKRHRANTVLDHLVPFYAMIDGIAKGEPERMLPGYSIARGVASFLIANVGNLEQTIALKRNEQCDLERERDSTREKINTQRDHLRALEKDMEHLNSKKVELTWETQRYGRQLTALHEVLITLKKMLTTYGMLQGDISMIRSFIDDRDIRNGLCESFEGETRTLLNRFKAIALS